MKKVIAFISTYNYAEKKTLWFLLITSFLLTITLIIQKNQNTQQFLKSTIPLNDSVFAVFFNEHQQSEISNIQLFDPNLVPIEEIISFGLSPSIAKRFDSYRKKFPFKSANEMYKIYGIDSNWVTKVLPFIYIDEKNKDSKTTPSNNKIFIDTKKELKPHSQNNKTAQSKFIKMNVATLWEWMDLKGIGAKTGERILNYKENLGGFIDKYQLFEVWGIDSFVWTSQWDNIILDTIEIKRINLNTDSFKYLIKHPYIESKTAKLILNYRLQHGDYNNIRDLYKIKALPEKVIKKLTPYVRFG